LIPHTTAARRTATLVGLGAVLLWSLLAPLTVGTGAVPPLLLTGLAFLTGGTLGLCVQLALGRGLGPVLRVPATAWLLGVGGFFGYHFVYFTALRLLPPVEALLIINTWPLLIILLTALIPGERLLPRHLVGGAMGLAGAALIVLARDPGAEGVRSPAGYLLAVAAALIWSGYSVLNRRLVPDAPTDAVTGFCLSTGLLALLAHAALEPPVWPEGGQWAVVLALGLGPVGAAFYLWDHGTKRGDLRILGASAYAAPLIGTLLLLALGHGRPSLGLLLAAFLIVGGALLASGDLLRQPAARGRDGEDRPVRV
jgi:drug/metabolite transporter (DMT)-like permease